MKRIVLIAFLLVAVILSACSTSAPVELTQETMGMDAFYDRRNEVVVYYGMPFKDLKKIYGEPTEVEIPEEYKESVVVGTHYDYPKDGLYVVVKDDIVTSIYVTDKKWLTKEGIKVGSRDHKVLEVYGEPVETTEEDGNVYKIDEEKSLYIVFTKSRVTQMQVYVNDDIPETTGPENEVQDGGTAEDGAGADGTTEDGTA